MGWTGKILLNQIKAKAYERTKAEKKTHNFESALPVHLAEQANEAIKSRYNLEFLGLDRPLPERQLEDRLIAELQHSDNLEVESALKTKGNPIGVANYHLQPDLPTELKGKLPSALQLANAIRLMLPPGGR